MCGVITRVDQCALRARSTHGVHHAIVEVNIVIGVVLDEVLVARVVPLVVDAVIGLALGLIAHAVGFVFVVAIFQRILLYWRYIVYRTFRGFVTSYDSSCWESVIGFTTVKSTVCLPSVVSFPHAVDPDWVVE